MDEKRKLVFIHGLEGSSQGFKATILRGLFPQIVIPDFRGSLLERMERLNGILLASPAADSPAKWTIIGSSFGGLMGAIFTSEHPELVHKLILLAPALIWPDFAGSPLEPVPVPTVVIHGTDDTLIPLQLIRPLVETVFPNHEFHAVEDDHGLGKTAQTIDWHVLVK